jgi:hypothetical protein
MRLASRALTALLALAAAGALTAAAQPVMTPSSGPSGTEVTLTPYFRTGTTCSLWVDDGEVESDFPCGLDPNSKPGTFISSKHAIKGLPGEHDIIICQPRCEAAKSAARAKFEILAIVPDLKGMTRSAAEAALKKASLTLGGVVTGNGTKPDWRVTDQSPKPGLTVHAKAGVSITLEPPPPPVKVTVPEVRHLSLEDARTILTGLGLTVQPSSSSGNVVDQKPLPGTKVDPGSSVILTVQIPDPPGPPYALIVGALVLVILVVGLLVAAVRVLRTWRRRPADPGASPPPVYAHLVPPPYVTTIATATSSKPAADVHVRVTREVTVAAESRTP